MNFLSHYFHEQPCDDPYFICGVVLPDILSNYSKRNGEKVRVRPDRIQQAPGAQMISLGQGVQKHYFVDGFFHDSDYFNEYTGVIDEHIHQLAFDAIGHRQFAFSHVFLEILMDRVLLKLDQNTAAQMYEMLNKVDLKVLEEFLSTNTATEDAKKPTAHFDQFRKLQFIYHYADSKRFTGIMDAINQNLGNPPFSNKDKLRMESLIHDIEKRLLQATFPNFAND